MSNKRGKLFISLLMALVMTLAMSLTAMAATVTNNGPKGHTYKAYQIFKGTQAENSTELGDIEWGDDINASEFIKNLKANETVKDDFETATAEDAEKVAEIIGKYGDNSDKAKAVAKCAAESLSGEGTAIIGTTVDLADGYYLIKDVTENLSEGDAYNASLLQVTGDITIANKTDRPELEKKVKENTKYNEEGGYGEGYNDVADYNIGDDVPFELIAKIPDMSNYDTYKFIFHDTLSKGLTFNNDTEVYVATAKDATGEKIATTDYEIGGETETDSFTVTFKDLKTVSGVEAGKYIIVRYTATLNKDAEIGLPGNENKATLEYSNNPDHSGSGDNHPTGETPEDKVIVFTYQLDGTKVTKEKGEDGKETTITLADAEFKLHTTADGGKWAKYDDVNNKWTWVDTEEDGDTFTSDKDGKFTIKGLDAGEYYLTETKAPAGYNKLKNDLKLTITANTDNGQDWDAKKEPKDALTDLTVKVEEMAVDGAGKTIAESKGNLTDGTVPVAVENNKGTLLPSTGGIGTTIFYVGGGILMAAAVILLVVKKRRDNA